MAASFAATREKDARIRPARASAAAAELFYRHGIRAVGVDAIAEAAGTNKMTLYRHFSSKDELVAEYLRQSASAADECWGRFAQAHPGDPLAQLWAWIEEMASHLAQPNERGCTRQCGDRIAREGSSGPPGDRGVQKGAAVAIGAAERAGGLE